MSNYTKLVNYAVKDVLPTGNINKIIRGTELDLEFAAIAGNMATKGEANNGQFTNATLSNTTLNGSLTINASTTVNGSVYFTTSGGNSFTFDNAIFSNITINTGFIDNTQIGLSVPSAGYFSSVDAVQLEADNAIIQNGTVIGTFTVPTPTVAGQVANKGYVDSVVSALNLSGAINYATYANALADIANIAEGRAVVVLVDETRSNLTAYYQKVSGALSFVSFGDYYVSPVPYIQSNTQQKLITKLLVLARAIPSSRGIIEADFTNPTY